LLGIGGEIANAFLRLDTMLDQLKAETKSTIAGTLRDEMERLRAVLRGLRESAAEDARRANSVLAEGL
jgi:hypothetical protein